MPSPAPRSRPADSSSASAPAARATLARSILAVLRAPDARDGQRAQTALRPLGDGSPATPKWRERFAYTGARGAWRAKDAAQVVLAHDVGVYARALRDGGMARRGVLASVVALVREVADEAVAGDWLDTVVHDTGRYCTAGYFAR
jgi:hypothetical protein